MGVGGRVAAGAALEVLRALPLVVAPAALPDVFVVLLASLCPAVFGGAELAADGASGLAGAVALVPAGFAAVEPDVLLGAAGPCPAVSGWWAPVFGCARVAVLAAAVVW